MSVNGVTGATDAYRAYTSSSKAGTEPKKETTSNTTAESSGAVYEPSKETANTAKTYKTDTKVVAKLKADAEARTAQLQSLVEKMMSQQTNTYGKANDIWRFLASGKYTVDPATKAQAQADIAEDGYWGVSQTSQRILDFATALTGGDPDKIDEMRSAFEKGFKQAEKTWGGKLPDISQKTYEAVLDGFDKMAKDAGITTD